MGRTPLKYTPAVEKFNHSEWGIIDEGVEFVPKGDIGEGAVIKAVLRRKSAEDLFRLVVTDEVVQRIAVTCSNAWQLDPDTVGHFLAADEVINYLKCFCLVLISPLILERKLWSKDSALEMPLSRDKYFFFEEKPFFCRRSHLHIN